MQAIKRVCADMSEYYLTIDGRKTAVYSDLTSLKTDRKPIILFIHGINDSFEGMHSLALSLLSRAHVLLFDMPGHGDSEALYWSDLTHIRSRFERLVAALTDTFGAMDLIVAHSYGCYLPSSALMARIPTIFVCPVPSISRLEHRFTAVLARLFARPFWVNRYYGKAATKLRDAFVLHDKTPQNRRQLRNLEKKDLQISAQKRHFQAQLAANLPAHPFEQAIPDLVITGDYDILTHEKTQADYREIFPDSEHIRLRSGHLAMIEALSQLTAIIASHLTAVEAATEGISA